MGHEGTTFTLAPLPRGRWCRGSASLHGIHCLGLGLGCLSLSTKGGRPQKIIGSRGSPGVRLNDDVMSVLINLRCNRCPISHVAVVVDLGNSYLSLN